MKKILILTLIVVCISLIIFFVFKSKYKLNNDLLSLTIKEESLTSSKATLILKNNTDSTYIYGSAYSIEKKIFGTWYIIIPENELIFNLIGYDLKAGETKEIEVDWEYGYGKLEPGKYRVIKSVSRERDMSREPSDTENFKPVDDLYISVEFIINHSK